MPISAESKRGEALEYVATLRLTEAQRRVLERLGGVKWLRSELDKREMTQLKDELATALNSWIRQA